MAVKVLIVDDSPVIREIFSQMLKNDPEILVVGTAEDPIDARDKIKELQPDVLTLDIEMPKMDGITFLKKIMSLKPMPVVMVSTLTQKGAAATVECLEIGAVDYIGKTSASSKFKLEALEEELCRKVKMAARAKVKPYEQKVVKTLEAGGTRNKIVAIGASTGGVEAIRDILAKIPENCPPILIVQHMPAAFTGTFASRLDGMCKMTVKEAADGDMATPGQVLIAPGEKQMRLVKKDGKYAVTVAEGEKVSGHCPSVDVLFDSVSQVAKDESVGVILTGMGNDGAAGLLKMREAGAVTIGQDEESCTVYGMPQAAFKMGGVGQQVPLKNVAETILKWA